NEAKTIAIKRMANPRIVPLAWYRDAWEEQERVLGPDPCEYGLTEENRKVLETLVGYSHEQGLIKNRPTLDQLFLAIDTGRKRGESTGFSAYCAAIPKTVASGQTKPSNREDSSVRKTFASAVVALAVGPRADEGI